MKWLIVFAFVAIANALDPGLRVRFDVGLFPGRDFYYQVPRTVAAATEAGWTLTDRPDGPLSALVLYCPEDKILCAFFDDTDRINGLQIALPQDESVNAAYDFGTIGYTEWTPAVADGATVKKYWTLPQFFISEETLSLSTAERLSKLSSDETLREGAVWVTSTEGKLVKITTNEADATTTGIGYTRQACIPGMGRHYYYNMTTELECTGPNIFNWFLLYQSSKLVATGFLSPGQLPVVDGKKNWFERPPRLAVKAIVPRGPECLYDLADNPGLVTMHIYYVEKPYLITCL